MSDARLLHIENLKYSQNCEGVTGAWTEGGYHKADCEWELPEMGTKIVFGGIRTSVIYYIGF